MKIKEKEKQEWAKEYESHYENQYSMAKEEARRLKDSLQYANDKIAELNQIIQRKSKLHG
tara:strand:- start:1598 stop:1777 length:180 start_codon:yes stop_codon:yes gene_type:complete